MDGCTALVKRMPPHLKKVHKLLPASVEFKAALSRVRRLVGDSHRRPHDEKRSSPGKDKGESSVRVEALEDSEDEIEVRRRSSHRHVKSLDDSESESETSEHRSIYTRVVEIEDSEAPLKVLKNCLKMLLLNLKPGFDQPTEVSLMRKPANSMEIKFPSF